MFFPCGCTLVFKVDFRAAINVCFLFSRRRKAGILPSLEDLLFYTIAEGQERIPVHKFITVSAADRSRSMWFCSCTEVTDNLCLNQEVIAPPDTSHACLLEITSPILSISISLTGSLKQNRKGSIVHHVVLLLHVLYCSSYCRPNVAYETILS